MIVKIVSYRVYDRKVVYLDTDKIWGFSFETTGKDIIFEVNGKVIFKDTGAENDDNFLQYYFDIYEEIKGYFTGEQPEIYSYAEV